MLVDHTKYQRDNLLSQVSTESWSYSRGRFVGWYVSDCRHLVTSNRCIAGFRLSRISSFLAELIWANIFVYICIHLYTFVYIMQYRGGNGGSFWWHESDRKRLQNRGGMLPTRKWPLHRGGYGPSWSEISAELILAQISAELIWNSIETLPYQLIISVL